jgi:RTX calcium-binding nonapeptide repeat (4 copies)
VRTGWFQACRGAIAFLGLVALCAPVALATPPEEPAQVAVEDVVAADEVAAPVADEVVAAGEVVAPAADEVVAADGVAAAAGDVVAADGVVAAADEVVAPRDEVVAPGDDLGGAPPAAPPRAAAAPLVSASTAQDQPPPAEPAPQPPPTSDPSCVFPQYHPALADEPCDVLASDCTVLGTAGPDILIGGATADLICGLGGDDEIDGGDGHDSILGGDGNDRITGGPGADCLLGQAGEDEFVDTAEANEDTVDDIAVEEYEDFPGARGTEGFRVVDIGSDGVCHVLGVASQPLQPPQHGLQEVEVAAVVYELSRLLDEASGNGAAEAFPLELPSTARAEDGVARLLLDCDQRRVTGTLELFERRGDRRVSAGEAEFDCTPPSEVVEVELEDGARERLEDRGRLAVIARVAAEGYAEHEDRLTIRSAP